MEITKIKFEDLLGRLHLPEYVFSKKFKQHYLFTDLLLNNYCESKFVLELLNSLMIKSEKSELNRLKEYFKYVGGHDYINTEFNIRMAEVYGKIL